MKVLHFNDAQLLKLGEQAELDRLLSTGWTLAAVVPDEKGTRLVMAPPKPVPPFLQAAVVVVVLQLAYIMAGVLHAW